MLGLPNNPWLVHFNQTITTKIRLFCFHHSGGTASFFRGWEEDLQPGVALIAIQLPGREARNSELFITDMKIVTKQIVDNFSADQTATPFMFFGHSLGGIIAFEVAHEFRRRHLNLPEYLIVSGRSAPQLQSKKTRLHHLPDHLFIQELIKYNGMPTAILQNKELLEILLPRLRADFTLSETYQYQEKPPLACPILVLGGKDDLTVNYHELTAWEKQTTKKCTINLFPGEHFFLNPAKKDILTTINLLIKNILAENH